MNSKNRTNTRTVEQTLVNVSSQSVNVNCPPPTPAPRTRSPPRTRPRLGTRCALHARSSAPHAPASCSRRSPAFKPMPSSASFVHFVMFSAVWRERVLRRLGRGRLCLATRERRTCWDRVFREAQEFRSGHRSGSDVCKCEFALNHTRCYC